MAKQEVTTKTYVEKIDKLLPNESNPRKIGRKEYDSLKKSLKEFPEMKQLREIVVDEQLKILGGHQRIYALKELGYEDVIVKQVFGLTEQQKREFIIKDNASAGEWDSDIIANEWNIDEIQDWGVPAFKFGMDDGENTPKEKREPKEIECPSCGHTFYPSESGE